MLTRCSQFTLPPRESDPRLRLRRLATSAVLALGGMLIAATIPEQAAAAPNHLEEPPFNPFLFDENGNPVLSYDNAELLLEYGQSFVAEESAVAGVRVYIDDPSRPDNPSVNELTGPADLVLYDASDLSNLVELGRSEVAASGVVLSGLSTLFFDTPIATSVGNRYLFVISTTDPAYGIGLRSVFESTYAGGSTAVRDPNTGVGFFHEDGNDGRDLSFEILGPAVVDLSLAPATSTRLTLTQHCVAATATNFGGIGVPGVPVSFAVTGVNPGTGAGMTDAEGTATFCFNGVNGCSDHITASFMNLTAAASVLWNKRNTALTVTPVSAVIVTQGLQILIRISPRATLRDSAHNTPIAGKSVSFKAGNTPLCTATTNASGVATCTVSLANTLAGVLSLGYNGNYAGDTSYNPSSGNGGILGLKLF